MMERRQRAEKQLLSKIPTSDRETKLLRFCNFVALPPPHWSCLDIAKSRLLLQCVRGTGAIEGEKRVFPAHGPFSGFRCMEFTPPPASERQPGITNVLVMHGTCFSVRPFGHSGNKNPRPASAADLIANLPLGVLRRVHLTKLYGNFNSDPRNKFAQFFHPSSLPIN